METYPTASSPRRFYLYVAAFLTFFLLIGSSWHISNTSGGARLLSGSALVSSALSPITKQHDTLIFFVYYEEESGNALANSKFFIDHALHDGADFAFILQGDCPKMKPLIPIKDNIRIIQRENTCMDLGAYGEVLRAEPELVTKYKKFMFINASVRGPFMPHWSNQCWSKAFTDRVTETNKIVGMSGHCMWGISQIQSMVIVTDSEGLQAILDNGSFQCEDTEAGAIQHEIHMSEKLYNEHGWTSDVMLTAIHGDPVYANNTRQCEDGPKTVDHLFEGNYFGFDAPFYETIFVKANRNINQHMLKKYTEWHDNIGYSSYDYC